MSSDEQVEEHEALMAIFEGDPNFVANSSTSFQYKFGDESAQSFLLGVEWSSDYPNSLPSLNLDLFHNNWLSCAAKDAIRTKVLADAENYLGMAMTFSVINFVKENFDEIIAEARQHIKEPDAKDNASEDDDENLNSNSARDSANKKSQMSKSQKRKMWDRVGAAGERERGWDWIDLVKHLQQTGGSQATEA